jgi:hypothetical protein
MMSNPTLDTEDFQINDHEGNEIVTEAEREEARALTRYEIVVDGSKAATWERIAKEHDLHAGPRRTVDAIEVSFAPDDADVTTAALYEANILLIADAPTHRERYKAWLRSMPGSQRFVSEHLNSICASTLRKHRMRDKDAARLEREYGDQVHSDTETEIGRNQLYDIEDELMKARGESDMWQEMHTAAVEVYESITGKMWQDPERMKDSITLVSDIASRWEAMIKNVELMKLTKIFVTGGNEHAKGAAAEIAKIKERVGDKLVIIHCENDSGFNEAVALACRDLKVHRIPVRYRDRFARNKEPQRIRDAFAMAPNGVVVMGGGGPQIEAIKLANSAGIKKRIVAEPVLGGMKKRA